MNRYCGPWYGGSRRSPANIRCVHSAVSWWVDQSTAHPNDRRSQAAVVPHSLRAGSAARFRVMPCSIRMPRKKYDHRGAAGITSIRDHPSHYLLIINSCRCSRREMKVSVVCSPKKSCRPSRAAPATVSEIYRRMASHTLSATEVPIGYASFTTAAPSVWSLPDTVGDDSRIIRRRSGRRLADLVLHAALPRGKHDTRPQNRNCARVNMFIPSKLNGKRMLQKFAGEEPCCRRVCIADNVADERHGSHGNWRAAENVTDRRMFVSRARRPRDIERELRRTPAALA